MFDLSREYSELAKSDRIRWDLVDGRTFLITGVTGLIGSLCTRLLLERNRTANAGISILALVRNEEKARSMLGEYGEDDGLRYIVQDVCDFSISEPCDYIIHTACPTASSFFAAHPVETADAIVLGTRRILEYATSVKSSSVVYVSSMEVYGNGNSEPGLDHLLTEADTGYVNPCSIRSCYPEGKRMAENYCASFASEYGTPVKVARLAQTFGPGIPKNDTRLFAQVARCAMNDTDLVLKTTGASTRMYSYTTDAVAGIMTALLCGENGVSYNVANPSTYSSVREMAERVITRFSEGGAKLVIDVDPNAPYPPEHHLPLDVSKLQALGWSPTVGLEEMYRNLIDYLS